MTLNVEKSPDKIAELLSPIVGVEKLSKLPKTAVKIKELSDSEIVDSIEYFRNEAKSALRKAVLAVYVASLRGEESFENICSLYSQRYCKVTMYGLKQVATKIIPFLIENKIEVNDVFNLKNGAKYLLNPKLPGHKRVLEAVRNGMSGNALARLVREIKSENKDFSHTLREFEDDGVPPDSMAAKELEKSIRSRVGALGRKQPSEAVKLLLQMAKELGWNG